MIRNFCAKLFEPIKKLVFDLPDFQNQEAAQRAIFLQSIFQIVFVMCLFGFFLLPFLEYGGESFIQAFQLLVIVSTALIGFRWLILRQKITWAGFLFSVVIWLTLAAFSLSGTGLTGIIFLVLISLTPFLVGFALGTWPSVAVSFFNTLIGYWLAYQEQIGVLPIGSDYDPYVRQLGYVVIFSTLPYMVYVWRSSIEMSINQAAKTAQAEQQRHFFKEQSVVLEETVEARTAEMEIAKNLAEQANQAKSTFLANMSHEMRSPLNAIIGYSEILFEDSTDSGDMEAAADLAKIQQASRHLLAIISNILDISKIDSGNIEVFSEPIEIAKLIQEVTSIMANEMDRNQNTLIVENSYAETIIRSDYTKLKQVLINLLSNAAKFTDQGEISLLISDGNQPQADQRTLEIVVKDTGIGISAQDLKTVFEPFQQVDSGMSRKQDGTGLGLPISIEYVRLLGGNLTVKSEVGVGSEFRFTLPV